ncbi:MAG: sigma-70 family RNA polymerase sigma factor [Phycisphaerae bacterium]|nr:sigma-70 family RNA polymerase sigma factor [Phycisphaerae bacterium]
MAENVSNVTLVLQAAAAGDRQAANDLLPLVYDELRALARARLAKAPPGNTLQATALVHEAYLKVVGESDPQWEGRGHFFGAAARAMRNILVDQARRKASVKHGGEARRANETPEIVAADDVKPEQMISLDASLSRLEAEDPRKAQVVMLRVFCGLTNEQTAGALGVSVPTVERDWRFARSWLQREVKGSE